MSDTYFIPERTTAHRKAVELFSEDFFWDITDDNSPFGNDDGADTLANLYRYFQEGETDLVAFVDDLLAGWGVPNKNLNLTSAEEIQASMEEGDADLFIAMRDNAIVATAFGEFLIRGTISDDVRHQGSNALKRQALPAFAADWVEPEERAQRLKIMEDKLQAMNGA